MAWYKSERIAGPGIALVFFMLASGGVAPQILHAQDKPDAKAEKTEPESDFANVNLDDLLDTKVIFSASKRAQTIDDSPNAISVITADDIRAMGAVNLIDVFRRLPGVYVYVRSGQDPLLSIRGRTSAYPSGYLLLVDGVSLYDAQNGGVDWSRLPLVLDDIERVELIRGPGGTLYGSNAFYGVINITTKRPANDSTVRSVTTGGSQSTVHQYGSVAIKSDKFSFRMSGKFEQTDGFEKGVAKPSVYDSGTYGNILLRSDVKPNEKTDLSFQIGTHFGKRDVTGAQVNRPDNPNPVFDGYYYAGIRHKLNADNTLEFKTSAFTMQERYSIPTTYTPASNHFYGDFTAFNNEVAWSHSISSDVDLLAGAQHRYQYAYSPASALMGFDLTTGFDPNKASNFTIFDRPRINQQVASSYLQVEVREGRWMVFNSGVRFEYDTFTDSVSPQPRLSILLRPAEEHTIRLAVSRATRIPSMNEHGVGAANFPDAANLSHLQNTIGSHSLKAETITAAELGYRGNFFEGKATLDIQTFVQYVHDAIRIEGPVGTAPYTFFGSPVNINSFGNNENFRAAGFETELSVKPVEMETIRANYSFIREYSKNSNVGFDKTTPMNMLNFSSETRLPTHTTLFVAGAYHSSFQGIDNLFSLSGRVKQGFRFDVTLRQAFFDDKVALSVIGQNVLDTEGPNFVDEAKIGVTTFPRENQAPQAIFGRLEVRL